MAEVGILGFGLAGALLAHALARHGIDFCWADEALRNAASPMAPGIVNPLAGRRFRLSSDYAHSRRESLGFINEIERALGLRFWHPLRLVRLIEHAEQRMELELRRAENPEWIGNVYPPHVHGEQVQDPFGSFETRHAGWLDIGGMVTASKRYFAENEVAAAAMSDRVRRIVDCRGWRCANDEKWCRLPWRNARGEVIEIELEGELPRHLWNGGGWLQPLPEGRWRAGATYAWNQLEAPQSLVARSELVAKLSRWLRLPYRIHAQRVGVRSVLVDHRPVLGPHPDSPQAYIFSGLGSHGAIHGPLFARMLAAHLAGGAPIPDALSPRRFLRPGVS